MKNIFIIIGITFMLSFVFVTGAQEIQLQAGEHVGEDGQQIMVRQRGDAVRLEIGGKAVESLMKINQEMISNRTKLGAQLSNGRNAEIKIMPRVASETALERLRLKFCVEAEGCSIELKEVGKGERAKLAYEVKTQRRSKIFGLFEANMQVKAQVNAENGELIRVNKPWWAFLASEPEE